MIAKEFEDLWLYPCFNAGVLAVVAIGTYWSALVASLIVAAFVVVSGARAIASVGPDPEGDYERARAIKTLASPLWAAILSQLAGWFILGFAVGLLVAAPPLDSIARLTPSWPVTALIVAVACSGVLWERHQARRTLQSKDQ